MKTDTYRYIYNTVKGRGNAALAQKEEIEPGIRSQNYKDRKQEIQSKRVLEKFHFTRDLMKKRKIEIEGEDEITEVTIMLESGSRSTVYSELWNTLGGLQQRWLHK